MENNWKKVRLGEICTIRRGSSPRPIVDYMASQGMPWVKISDATESKTRYINKTNEFIKHEGVGRSVIVNEGDLILSNSGTAGLPKFMGITACIHDGWQVFSNLIGIDKEFLYYTLLNIRAKLLHNAYDSTMKNLTLDMVRDAEIMLPTIDEQKAIASILSSVDKKIENTLDMNQTLEQMAQSLFKSWFVDFDPVVDNALDAGFFEKDLEFSDELLHRAEARKAARESVDFKPLPEDIRQLFPAAFEKCSEPSLGLGCWVPEGWKGLSIKSHCAKIQNGGTPSRSNPEYWDDGNIPWLTSGEVRQSIITRVENTITDIGLQNSSAKWVGVRSTLVALYGATAGEVSINSDPLTTNQAVCALIPKESYCWLNYLQVRNKTIEMQNNAVGSAQQNISKGLVENLIVISPPLNIVEMFHQKAESLFVKAIANNKMVIELARLRNTLLPKLISGELCIGDSEVDTADEVLA